MSGAEEAVAVPGTHARAARPRPPFGAATSRRVRVMAAEEFRQALESRWMFGFAAVFTALVLGLSYFGMLQAREVGFQGFARLTLSLMNLVLFIVPLAGLMLGVGSVASTGGTLPLLLAQPVARGEVLAGKFLGLAAALAAAQAVGFGAGGLVVAWQAGAEHAGGFLALAGSALALGTLSVGLGLCIATVWPDRLRALAIALLAWLVMAVAYDLVVLAATLLLRGFPLQAVLFPAMLLNPVDLARVIVTLAVGSGALLGPTSAVLVRTLGGTGGMALAAGVLLIQTAVPLVIAARVFSKRDW